MFIARRQYPQCRTGGSMPSCSRRAPIILIVFLRSRRPRSAHPRTNDHPSSPCPPPPPLPPPLPLSYCFLCGFLCANGAGVVFFLVLVSWGKLRPPPGWEGEWRDPYPVSLRVLALAKWVLLLLFQVRNRIWLELLLAGLMFTRRRVIWAQFHRGCF